MDKQQEKMYQQYEKEMKQYKKDMEKYEQHREKVKAKGDWRIKIIDNLEQLRQTVESMDVCEDCEKQEVIDRLKGIPSQNVEQILHSIESEIDTAIHSITGDVYGDQPTHPIHPKLKMDFHLA